MSNLGIPAAWPRALLFRDTDTAMVGGTAYDVPWETVGFDSHGGWSAATPTIFTIPVGGFWLLLGCVVTSALATAGELFFRRNGVNQTKWRVNTPSFNGLELVVMAHFEAAAGDTFGLRFVPTAAATLSEAAFSLSRQGF